MSVCCATTEASAFALPALSLILSLPTLWTTAAVHYVSSFSLSSLPCYIQSIGQPFWCLSSFACSLPSTDECLCVVVSSSVCVYVCLAFFLFLRTHIHSSIDRLGAVRWMAVYACVCVCLCEQAAHREGASRTTTMHAYILHLSILPLPPP
jgi:hypothetical protein